MACRRALTQKAKAENHGSELFRQRRVGGFHGHEIDRLRVPAFVVLGQRVADLVPAYIGAVEFVGLTHTVHIGVAEIGFP